MTLPDRAPPRKPRRLGLYAPFALLLILVAAWSLGWAWLRGEVLRRLDEARDAPGAAAIRIDWTRRAISGFPFRLDLDLADARFSEGSGWAITAPRLNAEAFVFAPSHWVAVAPAGVVFRRRGDRPVIIKAKVLRASLSGLGERPPRLSIEGLGLTFATARGAAPYLITAAEGLHLHTRAGPGGQGAVYIEVDRARARLAGLVGRIAAGQPITFMGDGIYSHADVLAGRDWPAAVRAWSGAGGAMGIRRLRLEAGRAFVDARAGSLSVGGDGRLRGSLGVSVRQAPRTLAAMSDWGALPPESAREAESVVGARASGPLVNLTLDFQAGRTTLGPAAIGPAPRIY